LPAELEVRADPRVVGHRGGDVGPAGHAVHRVAVPLAAEQLPEGRAHAVGHDQAPAVDLEGLVAAGEHDGADAATVAAYVDGSHAVDRPRTGLDRGGGGGGGE